MALQKIWTNIKATCFIVLACFTALVKFVLKFPLGIYRKFINPTDAHQKIYKTVADIPGKISFPIIGTRWIYLKFGSYKLNAVHLAYEAMFSRFGDIIREEALWNLPVISVIHRECIEIVLRQSGKYPIRPPNEVTASYRRSRPDRYTNTGVANEQGVVWASLRNQLTPILTSPGVIKDFLPEIKSLSDDFIHMLCQVRNKNDVVERFEGFSNIMGLESACMLILGRRINGFLDGVVSETATKLVDAVTKQFRTSHEAFYGLPLWKIIKTKAYKEFIASEDTFYEIMSGIVDSVLNDQTQSSTSESRVFGSILRSTNLDVKEKKAMINEYIPAGIKTFGNTLVFLLYLIAKHPEVQEKLYNEISRLAPAGTPITNEHLKEAEYLNACIMEAHRVKPTAPCIARVLESDIIYDDYCLSKGTVVLMHTGLACLDERNFKDATSYIPERWMDKETYDSLFLITPFGCGKRICPGKQFIELELKIVLAKMVKQFHIGFEGELKTEFEFILTPVDANFILHDRN